MTRIGRHRPCSRLAAQNRLILPRFLAPRRRAAFSTISSAPNSGRAVSHQLFVDIDFADLDADYEIEPKLEDALDELIGAAHAGVVCMREDRHRLDAGRYLVGELR